MDQRSHAARRVIRNGAKRRLVAGDGTQAQRHAAIKLRSGTEGRAKRHGRSATGSQRQRCGGHGCGCQRFLHSGALHQPAPFGRRASHTGTTQRHGQAQPGPQATHNGGRAVQAAGHFIVRHRVLIKLHLAVSADPIRIGRRAGNGIRAGRYLNFYRHGGVAQPHQIRAHALSFQKVRVRKGWPPASLPRPQSLR